MFGVFIQYEADRPEGGQVFLAVRKTKEAADKRAEELATERVIEGSQHGIQLQWAWADPTEENYLPERAILIHELLRHGGDCPWQPLHSTIYVDAIKDHD